MIGPFVVPGFLAAASGFLLILLMLAQALGAMAWLPVVRRRIGDGGLRLLDAASGTGLLIFAGLLGWRTLREG